MLWVCSAWRGKLWSLRIRWCASWTTTQKNCVGTTKKATAPTRTPLCSMNNCFRSVVRCFMRDTFKQATYKKNNHGMVHEHEHCNQSHVLLYSNPKKSAERHRNMWAPGAWLTAFGRALCFIVPHWTSERAKRRYNRIWSDGVFDSFRNAGTLYRDRRESGEQCGCKWVTRFTISEGSGNLRKIKYN